MFAAVDIASLFFRKGTLVFRTEGRIRSANRDYITEKDGAFSDMPLVVLVDHGSASAAEALAASLQDHDRALLLGRRSFGKALMQQALPVPPQGDMVWLTLATWSHPVAASFSARTTVSRPSSTTASPENPVRTGHAQDVPDRAWTERARRRRNRSRISRWPNRCCCHPGSSPRPTAASTQRSPTASPPPSPRIRRLGLNGSSAVSEWQTSLVKPFVDRVHSRLQVTVEPDSALAARLGRILAYRVTEVRWGPDAVEEMALRNDPDLRAASNYTNRID